MKRLLSLLILLAIGSPLFAQNSQATLTITPNPQPTGIVISSWKIYKAMGTGAAPTTVLTMLPVGTLTYIDTAVTPGNSYSYAATSVSTAGVESGNSNVVVAVIPGTVTPPPPTPLSISTTALPAGTIGTPYSFSLAASGGTAPYSWSASGLPSALTLSKSGVFSGTPVTAGTFPIALTVTDSSSPTITVMLTLAAPPTPSVTMTCSGLVCTIVPKNIPSGTPFTVSVSIDGAVVTTTGITSTASAVLHSPKRTGGAK